MNNLKHFPSLSNGSTNGASQTLERDKPDQEDQELDIPTTPNGRLVKLARLDEDSTQYAISLLRPAGGDELKTVKYKGLVCTVPPSICQVFDLEYTDVANTRTSYKAHFEKLGVISIQDPEKVAALCNQFQVKRQASLSLYSLQSLVFLLLGMKNSIAGGILRHDIGIPPEKYSKLFDLAAIKVSTSKQKSAATVKPVASVASESKTVALPPSTMQAFQSVVLPAKSSEKDEAVDLLQVQLDWLIREREELTKEINAKITGLQYAIEVLKTSHLP